MSTIQRCHWCGVEGPERNYVSDPPQAMTDILGTYVDDLINGTHRTEWACVRCHNTCSLIMDRLERKHGTAYTSEIKRAMHIYLAHRGVDWRLVSA